MAEFFNFLTTALETGVDKLFIVAGLTFLGVAIVGGSTPYIRPGKAGRIVGGLFGPLLVVVGLAIPIVRSSSIHVTPPIVPPVLAQPLATTPTPVATPLPTRATTATTPTARPVRTPAPTPLAHPTLSSPGVSSVVQQRDNQMAELVQTEADYNRNAKQIIDSLGR